MDFIISVINGIQNVPPAVWASLAGVVGLSAFQQKIKNWLELENPKVLVLMTTVFSLGGTVMLAVLSWMSATPAHLTGAFGLWFTGMTLAYRYVVQPGQTYLAQLKEEKEKYKSYKLQKALAQPTAEESQAADAALEALAAEQPSVVQAPAVPAGVSPTFEG